MVVIPDTASPYGSSVSSQVLISDGSDPCLGRGEFQPRDDHERCHALPQDEERQALERHRRVPGQIAHVRPDADEHRLKVAFLCRRDGTLEALGEPTRRDGRALADHPTRSPASGRLIQVAIVAGPSSNILR